jgi:DNA invertase Pin-like site-specific DNA recombinase
VNAVVAAYLRVSSRAQDAASQRAAIERAAVARGDEITVWYSEKRSGKTLARPELDRVRAEVRAGALRRLYIYRLDRVTRSGIRDTLDVLEELRANGCEIVTVSDGFDLSGPYAEVIIAVMSWAAQMERVAINERISAARDRLEAEGRAWGRPARLTGLKLEQAKALRAEGRSIREIAVAMKVPRSTIGRALSQKVGPAEHGPSPADTADSPSQQGASRSCTSETDRSRGKT